LLTIIASSSKDYLKPVASCEGCFCYIATRRAEGDHYVDLYFREGVVEPKIQPRAINSAQGLMGYFRKGILKSQDNKAQINMEED
jgi:hypothetical protein